MEEYGEVRTNTENDKEVDWNAKVSFPSATSTFEETTRPYRRYTPIKTWTKHDNNSMF